MRVSFRASFIAVLPRASSSLTSPGWGSDLSGNFKYLVETELIVIVLLGAEVWGSLEARGDASANSSDKSFGSGTNSPGCGSVLPFHGQGEIRTK